MKPFTPICADYTYGYEARSKSGVLIQVIRHYAGDWSVYSGEGRGGMIHNRCYFHLAMSLARKMLAS